MTIFRFCKKSVDKYSVIMYYNIQEGMDYEKCN